MRNFNVSSSGTTNRSPLTKKVGVSFSIFGVIALFIATTVSAFAFNGQGHKLVTQKSLVVLQNVDPAAYNRFMSSTGKCADLPGTSFRKYKSAAALTSYYQLPADQKLIKETPAVDGYSDLEFVNVEGGAGSGGRDNPHDDEYFAIDDEAHYTEHGMDLTAYNHFIDIRKGAGTFDDYDGYAYRKGSASRGQYQSASNAASDSLARLMGKITGYKVDEGIMWWLNDEYIHAPGRSWYRKCSPSVSRYSFYGDKHIYASVNAEAAARFPLANSSGSSGKGIPYSVFMPVDNMARYWYGRFGATKDPATLGPVLHAIHDAAVPHHAAGCTGNWHSKYENELDSRIPGWLVDPGFENEVKALVALWSRNDPNPPTRLGVNDWTRTPALNWSIDQMATWVALHANREYTNTYHGFRNGYQFNTNSARTLVKQANAISILALKKALGSAPTPTLTRITATLTASPANYSGALTTTITFTGNISVDAPCQVNYKFIRSDGALAPLATLVFNAAGEKTVNTTWQLGSSYSGWQAIKVISPKAVESNKANFSISSASNNNNNNHSNTGEDLIGFDWRQAAVKQSDGRWGIIAGNIALLDFNTNEAGARKALQIIQHYKMNTMGFVGRPDPSMVYYLADNAAPSGVFPGEDSLPFSLNQIEAKRVDGSWKLVDGDHSLLDFGANESEAKAAYQLIKKYGFTHICFVGRPNAPMTYFRK